MNTLAGHTCRRSTDFWLVRKQFSVADPVAGWGGGGGKKHEIYAVAFGGHLFYGLFLQSRGYGPLAPPLGSATGFIIIVYEKNFSRALDRKFWRNL